MQPVTATFLMSDTNFSCETRLRYHLDTRLQIYCLYLVDFTIVSRRTLRYVQVAHPKISKRQQPDGKRTAMY